MAQNNSVNYQPINHNIILGAASGGINNLAPGATSTILRSTGTSADPAFTTNFKVSSGDIMTNSSQPFFFAYRSSNVSNVTGNGTNYTVIFDSTLANVGTVYNTGTGTFTAPVAGNYYLMANVTISSLNANATGGNMTFVTTARNFGSPQSIAPGASRDAANNFTLQGTCIAIMSANDTCTVTLEVSGTTQTIGVLGQAASLVYTYFSGYLIC